MLVFFWRVRARGSVILAVIDVFPGFQAVENLKRCFK